MSLPNPSSRLSPTVLLAFAAVYFVWGSTYLMILIGIETIPPFLLAGVRFLFAGGVLLGTLLLRGEARPTLEHWRNGAIVGGLMMFGGNGLVTWAEQTVSSGLAALLVSLVPVWMVLLDATLYRGPRPSRWTWVGLFLATLGVAVLVDPGAGVVSPVGAAVLLFASFCWANGSLLSRSLVLPRSPFLSASVQMVSGGAILLAVSAVSGEWSHFAVAQVSARSLWALLYLGIMGSIVTHTAYVYLLRVQTAAAVSTYAFVNPVIALLLGFWAGETLGQRSVLGALMVVGAVMLIHWARQKPRAEVPELARPALRLEPQALAVGRPLAAPMRCQAEPVIPAHLPGKPFGGAPTTRTASGSRRRRS